MRRRGYSGGRPLNEMRPPQPIGSYVVKSNGLPDGYDPPSASLMPQQGRAHHIVWMNTGGWVHRPGCWCGNAPDAVVLRDLYDGEPGFDPRTGLSTDDARIARALVGYADGCEPATYPWSARLVERWVIFGRQIADKPIISGALMPFLLLAVVAFTLFDRRSRLT